MKITCIIKHKKENFQNHHALLLILPIKFLPTFFLNEIIGKGNFIGKSKNLRKKF
jgi:hypothetical protein